MELAPIITELDSEIRFSTCSAVKSSIEGIDGYIFCRKVVIGYTYPEILTGQALRFSGWGQVASRVIVSGRSEITIT
jgi:hypothetical protein